MHQGVVIGPTGDAVELGGKELEFRDAKILGLFFEQENSHHLLFENPASEEFVGDLDEEIHSSFADDAATEAHRKFSQFDGVPAA